MRTPLIAGNWKMNKTVEQGKVVLNEMLTQLMNYPEIERVICPPFTLLPAFSVLLKPTGIGLGAQNLHWEAQGAFTGEVSAAMVKEFCAYVIIGHSERRTYFGETDESVNKKIKAALAGGLIPIVCVGETLAQYDGGQTMQVVSSQVKLALNELDQTLVSKIVIAYEPVWAIGTGRAATAEGANEVVAKCIRPAVAEKLGSAIADQMRILYGGSVTGANALEFFQQPDIDGALVGGASLKKDDFPLIVAHARTAMN
jgi:triosephosphate isomerase